MNSGWFLLESPPSGAAHNMAVDEALLDATERFNRPVFRLYSWNEPAASFGYFQKYADVERATGLRPLIRRPTGGGIVPHDADWTYSLVFPVEHEWYQLKATESYYRVHEWIQRAFRAINIDTELAECCRKSDPGQCFVGFEKSDVLWRGRKIAGAAQRRTKSGLLIQGSVQPPPISLHRSDWEQAMIRAAEVSGWDKFPMDSDFQRRVKTLSEEKYLQRLFNEKR